MCSCNIFSIFSIRSQANIMRMKNTSKLHQMQEKKTKNTTSSIKSTGTWNSIEQLLSMFIVLTKMTMMMFDCCYHGEKSKRKYPC